MNQPLAEHIELIAMLTELDDRKNASDGSKKKTFRATTFQSLAKEIRVRSEPVTVENMALIPRCGSSSREVIKDFLTTGTSDRLKGLSEHWPADALWSLTRVRGIGAVTALELCQMGITSVEQLAEAVETAKLNGKFERLKTAILIARDTKQGRVERQYAKLIADKVLAALNAVPGVLGFAEVCGSYRRLRDTVKDCDFVVKANPEHHKAIHETFCKLGDVDVSGNIKSTIYVRLEPIVLQCDLWTVEPWMHGAAVGYATGSKSHNEMLRGAYRGKGMRLNEKGIYRFLRTLEHSEEAKCGWLKDGGFLDGVRVAERIGGENESDQYTLLGLPWIDPENREG